MAAEHVTAPEPEQQVLAAGLDRLEEAAVQALGDSGRARPRTRCLDAHALPDERLETAGGAVQGIAFGHVGNTRAVSRARAAAAGAVAAAVWAAQEPLDQRVFGYDYSDVAVLGKFLTRGRGWRLVGCAFHVANGAAFALVYDEARRRLDVDPRRLAVTMALGEHLTLFSLGALVDRYHPARGEPGVPRLFSGRAFAQATWRHALFGWVLGRLA